MRVMYRMFQVGFAALILTPVVGAVQVAAPQVQLTIEPAATLFRGRTEVLEIRVKIPDGYFIPAETSGPLKGAWLQPLPPWLSRSLPTYPIPNAVRLPGVAAPVLAYSGDIVIHLPVPISVAMSGPQQFGVRFGYHLCDSSRCRSFSTSDGTTQLDVQDPPPQQALLAYRFDSHRVIIITEMAEHLTSDPPGAVQPAACFIPRVAVLAEEHQGRSRFVGDFAMGARWTIASSNRQFEAVAEQPAIVSWRCGGEAAPFVVIARIADKTFAAEPAKYFLASRTNPTGQRPISVNLQLTDLQRREVRDLINRQMRITLPTVFAPDLYVPAANIYGETEYDRQVRTGQARLMYHMEAFKLAPDENPRLYIRAYWRIGARAQIGLTLWVRFDGHHFSVEQTDGAVSRSARYLEMKDVGSDLAAQPEYAGMLLNVIPSPDGWAYVILGRRGYENVSVSVWKYSAVGPQDTGIAYSFGC